MLLAFAGEEGMIDGTQDLRSVDGFPFAVRASEGAESRAEQIARRVGAALGWLREVLGPGPVSVQLLVLDRSDWDRVASIPIYGMPHTFHDVEAGPTVVTGSEPAPFWDEVIAFMWPDVTPPTRERVLAVYGDPPVTGVGYSDLVVVHGLAHLFHGFDPDRGLGEFPRLWLSELFADLGMHGYLAEVEPEQVPVLQTVCLAAREVPPSRLPRSLDDMASALTIDPRFYCVFEHLLTFEAARVWDATGVEGLRRFHTELRRPEMTDDEILDALGRIHAPTAAVIREWAAGRRGSTAVPG